MYTGTLIEDLSQLANRARKHSSNDTLCEFCCLPLGSHSHEGLNCPNPSDVGPLFSTQRFSPLLCQCEVPESHWGAADSVACNQPMVVVETGESGMGYCAEHFRRTR
jgi:hypothetical protein